MDRLSKLCFMLVCVVMSCVFFVALLGCLHTNQASFCLDARLSLGGVGVP